VLQSQKPEHALPVPGCDKSQRAHRAATRTIAIGPAVHAPQHAPKVKSVPLTSIESSQSKALRMFLLDLGTEFVPKSVSVAGAPRTTIACPVIGIAVETAQGWVLLESGFSRAFLDDAEAQQTVYRGGPHAVGPPGEPLVEALRGVGLGLDDLALACVSHLHCDHTGGLPLLARAGVPVAVHRDELEFARTRASLSDGYYGPDIDSGVDWRPFAGDHELADGVWALETPGHTPGHVSFQIELEQTGTWLFAVDAADLAENLNERVPPGFSAAPEEAARAAASLERLLDLASELDARLVPGHDGAFWRAVRHPAGGHR
jgi:glyoxylase-like metal-dependent hydrolase (beta-lactamase superfamily II)